MEYMQTKWRIFYGKIDHVIRKRPSNNMFEHGLQKSCLKKKNVYLQ